VQKRVRPGVTPSYTELAFARSRLSGAGGRDAQRQLDDQGILEAVEQAGAVAFGGVEALDAAGGQDAGSDHREDGEGPGRKRVEMRPAADAALHLRGGQVEREVVLACPDLVLGVD